MAVDGRKAWAGDMTSWGVPASVRHHPQSSIAIDVDRIEMHPIKSQPFMTIRSYAICPSLSRRLTDAEAPVSSSGRPRIHHATISEHPRGKATIMRTSAGDGRGNEASHLNGGRARQAGDGRDGLASALQVNHVSQLFRDSSDASISTRRTSSDSGRGPRAVATG